MTAWTIDSAADVLLTAERERQDRGPLSDEWADLDLDTGYQVQDALIAKKVEAGESVIGVKLGLTSRAKQERMGISSPLTAVLTDGYILPADVPIPMSELIHPRIEPEIVFVMQERLSGPGVTSATAMSAVGTVHAGFEVIDSRYTDFKFTLPDVVADNASSARFVVSGRGVSPAELDLVLESVVLSVDGTVVDTATGAAVMGHPGEALALAANELGRRGKAIEAGDIVLTGGLTDAVFVHPGSQISAEFSSLGSLFVTAR
ncbi:4-oxalocrotonate decarboxylase [Leucobacter sp. Psy1]|uniref:2-keto-4-pentenoate hydratase n=1 Tax=Leucobacter sp. Psy1 TaxID=2875729 RepID=UPI001CD560DB|nr:fumarylacetoacetate hydrolase family protein [Leucobacter sp. Psy1]UBH07175.1 4-oxalocrotonate decarboxylase [Leucobacter sp. Psy1]